MEVGLGPTDARDYGSLGHGRSMGTGTVPHSGVLLIPPVNTFGASKKSGMQGCRASGPPESAASIAVLPVGLGELLVQRRTARPS